MLTDIMTMVTMLVGTKHWFWYFEDKILEQMVSGKQDA